ncbi:dTDP-4-dehydrorhamnose 3,5-epimerase family protein [uncultured Tenacibaculum sp.]|uniref:dTDP-4-dehydrorhamnose 3,5-epimerase family protein n=1 Tax=uncultured Tenacibaculum sp. TaxID=174713 RepID=UPI0026185D1A|nr:dTDP-4-dehydrorhamnose 3,5-epimerase family protein [uncultured Tenacibaculum sp.]
MIRPYIIEGGKHIDERGCINFVNDFDMSVINRLYYTEHFSTDVIRAWQAHIVEKRWFLCIEGEFIVKLVKIDDFENPSEKLEVYEFLLKADDPQVLFIPEGFANGFQAKKENSKLMIFSDYAFGINPDDQVRFDKNKWTTWN